MPDRSVAIANSFLDISGALGRVTQMQLQKLVYFSHGWNLAISGQPLCTDNVEAWDYGPVFRDLYDHAKYFGKDPVTRRIRPDDDTALRFFIDQNNIAPFNAELTQQEREIIQNVWDRYAHLNAFEMSNLTHMPETPWYKVYNGNGRGALIPNPLIHQHFVALGQAVVAD